MLAPRASSAFVCLRCQVKLAQPQRLPSIARLGPYSSFSSAPLRTTRQDVTKRKLRGPLKPINPRPLGNLRGRYGKQVRVGSASLGIESLGAPAEVIILRDAERDDVTEDVPTPQETKEGKALKQEEILASLQDERMPPAQDEVNKQIESLRPQPALSPDEHIYLSQAEFQKLYSLLYDGFTLKQLSNYFASCTGVTKDNVKGEILQGLIKGSSKGKRPAHQSEWRPGTSPIAKRLPGGNIGMLRKRQGPVGKYILADQILRKAWDIVLLEEIESLGELEISLKRWQLSLLTIGGTPTFLDQIGQARNAKIEIYWPHNVIRITADKSTAEYAAQDVEDYLRDTEAQRLRLEPWRPLLPEDQRSKESLVDLFRPKDITLAEEMSGAIIQPVSKDTFMVRGAKKEQVEDAERCLLAMLNLYPIDNSLALSNTRKEKDKRQSIVLSAAFKSALDYRYRDQRLGRWTHAVVRNPSGERSTTQSTVPKEQIEASQSSTDHIEMQVIRAIQRPVVVWSLQSDEKFRRKGSEPIWSRIAETRVCAAFGHILHPMQDGPSAASIKSNFDIRGVSKTMSKTVFSSTLPGLSRLLTQLELPPNSLFTEETLEYKFLPLPSKEQTDDSGKIYPRLLLRFLIVEDRTLRFRGLGIFLGEHITDAIIPDLTTDIKFKKQQMVWFRSPDADENIRTYLDTIKENFQGGGRLTAPRLLKLKVPTWTIRDPNIIIQEEWEKQDFVEMNYLFAGIEHRQIMRMDFHGHSLTYTSVQAGQLGGKRGELELRYSKSDTDKASSGAKGQTEVLSHFVKSAFKLADLINNSALNRLSMTELGILRRVQGTQQISKTIFREIDLSNASASNSRNSSKNISKDKSRVSSIETDPGTAENMPTLPQSNPTKHEEDNSGDARNASTENNGSTANITAVEGDFVVTKDLENIASVARESPAPILSPDVSSNVEMGSTEETRKHPTKLEPST
ncbi:hypothetical protein AOQ84DRAFT_340442 [Glonium stellatum]|uniref:Uncharacterized protein n=1 Tax=Glonium stellatum TaxID=574774 RepID=A0A8E2F183_9PEZI|nr:hypothetical protein AOQ84DRAFT_340442 [Glonium stellatum]